MDAVNEGIKMSWFIVLVFGAIIVPAIAVVAGLLAFPRTRPAGIVLVMVGLLLVVGLAVLSVLVRLAEARRPIEPVITISHNDIVTSLKPTSSPVESPVTPSKEKLAAPSDKKPGTAAPSAAPDRPQWVDRPPARVGDVYQMSVTVGPYTTRLECDANLPEAIDKAVAEYAEISEGAELARYARLPAEIVRQQLLKDQWEETYKASFGPMVRLHALLEFDHKINDELKSQCRRAVVAGRLWKTGVGVAGLLALLGVGLAYLKLDLASGGTHRRVLQLAAALAILGVIGAAALAARI